MKKILVAFIIFGAMAGCKNKSTVSSDKNTEKETLTAAAALKGQLKDILGSYVGAFGDNKITVLITNVTEDSISGRSIVAGNDRSFAGTIVNGKDGIEISAKEPGDDPHDGSFNFNISPGAPGTLSGSWTPYKADDPVGKKEFSLERKSFVYTVDAGEYSQASRRLLTEDDVNNLLKPELEQMRNEIFARHGYCFTRKTTRSEFEPLDWYIPNSTDIRNDLTAIEKKNISLIKKYEKYAEDYGDDFGR